MMKWTSFAVLLALLASLGCGGREEPAKAPYLERLRAFQSKFKKKGPAPQQWKKEAIPANVLEVTYPSGNLKLKAWVYIPPGAEARKSPALVYFHGGSAFGRGDLEDTQPFMSEKMVVMCPMLRGENGNPGFFELLWGEVDDAIAAGQWLARQPYVDARNLFAFGHSIGGGISSLVTLREDVPFRHTGSCGGLYNTTTFDYWSDIAPFDIDRSGERELRVLLGNHRDMKCHHYAYLGEQDVAFKDSIREAEKSKDSARLLTIQMVPGDHFSSLGPGLQRYLSQVKASLRRK